MLENVFTSGRKRDAARILFRSFKLGTIGTFFVSALPIAFLYQSMLAIALSVYIGTQIRKAKELNTPVDTMKNHDLNGIIDPNDIARYTILGMGYDFQQWKEMRIELQRNHGQIGREELRDLEHNLFPDMRPFCLKDSSQVQHVAVMMPTGGGKSELYKTVLRQTIAKGGGLIAVELKGTIDYVGFIANICKECNRMDDLRVIALDQPEHSHSYSPVFQSTTRGLISQLSSLNGKSGEEFFENVARFGATACVLCLRLQPGGRSFRLSDVAALLGDLDELRALVKQINPHESQYHQSGFQYLLVYLNFWMLEGQWNYREYKKLMLGLMLSFLGYCHSEYDSIINVYEPDVVLREALTEGKIIVFTASTNIDEKGVNQMGRLLMSNLSLVVGDLESQGFKAPVPTPLFLDEYRGMRDPRHINMWQLFRSVNVPIWVNVQNASMLEDPTDASFSTSVIGNSDTLITGRAKDKATRELIADAAGEFIEKLRTETVSMSSSAGASSDASGFVTQDNAGLSQSDGYRENKDTLVSPEDLRELEDGQFIIISREGVYRVIGPMTVTAAIPKWSELNLVRFRKKQTNVHGIYENYVNKLKKELL